VQRLLRRAVVLTLLSALAACGSDGASPGGGAGGREGAQTATCGQREALPERLPPFPEPAKSPPPRERPEGRVVALPGRPEGLAFDQQTGQLAIGINEPRGLVAFVDGQSGMIRRRIALPAGPRHLRFAGGTGTLLIPAEGASALIELQSGDREGPESTPVGRQPHDAVAAARGRIFVVNELDSSMSVVEDDRVVCTLPTTANPGGVAAAEGGGSVAAVGVRSTQLRLYDARSLRGMGEVGVGIGPTHVVSDGERRLFIADTRGDAIVFVRTRPRVEVRSRQGLPNSAPYGLAYDGERDELWVTSTERNRVVLFRRRERRRSFPTVRQPNSVAVDERTGRVFVAGRYGELQLIDPPKDGPPAGGGPG
jgi:hypothetical protein